MVAVGELAFSPDVEIEEEQNSRASRRRGPVNVAVSVDLEHDAIPRSGYRGSDFVLCEGSCDAAGEGQPHTPTGGVAEAPRHEIAGDGVGPGRGLLMRRGPQGKGLARRLAAERLVAVSGATMEDNCNVLA